MSNAPSHSLVSKGRVEALSDGVFAIAMTLLVLEIKVPDLPRHAPEQAIWGAVLHEWPTLLSYVMTFVLAGAFWTTQHIVLNAVGRFTKALLLINLVLLMFVALLPFSTGMLGHFPMSKASFVIYFANQFAISGCNALQLWMARRKGLMSSAIEDPETLQRIRVRVYALPLGCLAATALATVNPQYCVYGFAAAVVGARLYMKKQAAKTVTA